MKSGTVEYQHTPQTLDQENCYMGAHVSILEISEANESSLVLCEAFFIQKNSYYLILTVGISQTSVDSGNISSFFLFPTKRKRTILLFDACSQT